MRAFRVSVLLLGPLLGAAEEVSSTGEEAGEPQIVDHDGASPVFEGCSAEDILQKTVGQCQGPIDCSAGLSSPETSDVVPRELKKITKLYPKKNKKKSQHADASGGWFFVGQENCDNIVASEGHDVEGRKKEEKEASVSNLNGSSTPFSLLPQHLLDLHVFQPLPVHLNRSLCKTTKALADGEMTTDCKAQESLVSPTWVPKHGAALFPLEISLTRYSSFGGTVLAADDARINATHSEPQETFRVQYKLTLTSLESDAMVDMRVLAADDADSKAGAATELRRKTGVLPKEKVQRAFSEILDLRRKADGKEELVETGRRHFELAVHDAKGRTALRHVYKYRFPRSPVDGLLNAMLDDELEIEEEEEEKGDDNAKLTAWE